jgi:hypothetical protein
MISIEGSSAPFRAFFGAILSEIDDVSVEPSTFDPNMELDIISEKVEVENEDKGPLPEGDINDGSGPYKGTATKPPLTSRQGAHEGSDSDLMVRPFLHYHLSC